MHRNRAPLALLSVTLTMAATAFTAVAAGATPDPAIRPAVSPRPVMLIDGSRILPTTGAGRAGAILPAGGRDRPAAVTSFTIGGGGDVVSGGPGPPPRPG